MKKFHINANGKTGECFADKGSCPFGGDEKHYATRENAEKAYELSMAAETIPKAVKRADHIPRPTSGAYDVSSKAEVYEHPQGKKIEIQPDGSVIAYKNGSVVSTSATADKLRKGYGKWRRVGYSDQASPARKAQSKAATPRPSSRVQSLIANGYPKSSSLDPDKKVNTVYRKDGEKVDSGSSRPVLPTGTTIAPHGEEINKMNKNLSDLISDDDVIAVVKSSNGRRDIYRCIISGHDKTSYDCIGDRFPMKHDQSWARIGEGKWEVVGLFEPNAGGGVIGEVPNRKIPLYVYK